MRREARLVSERAESGGRRLGPLTESAHEQRAAVRSPHSWIGAVSGLTAPRRVGCAWSDGPRLQFRLLRWPQDASVIATRPPATRRTSGELDGSELPADPVPEMLESARGKSSTSPPGTQDAYVAPS